MKSRKPILYLSIVFTIVCLYQLSFTWKVNMIENDMKEDAVNQIELNRASEIENVTASSVKDELKNEMIARKSYRDTIIRNIPNFGNKKLVFQKDSINYFRIIRNEKVPVSDSLTIDRYNTQTDSFAIFNLNDIYIDTNKIDKQVELKIIEIENDYRLNRERKIKDLEVQYIRSISYDQEGKDIGVYNLFFKDYTYQECKDREINLGLDLKGGISVTLEVSIKDVLINYAKDEESPQYNLFLERLDRADASKKETQQGYLDLVMAEYKDVLDQRGDLSEIFSTLELYDEMNGLTNQEVLDKLRFKIEGDNGIIETTFTTLKERSQRFANTRPNILETNVPGRFIVELPGAEDVKRVNSILTDPAKLEFWEAFKFNEIYEQTAQGRIGFVNITDPDFDMLEWFSLVSIVNNQGQLLLQEDGAPIGFASNNNRDKLDEIFKKLESKIPNIKFSYGYLSSDKTRETLQVYALKTFPKYNDANEDGSVLSGDIISSSSAGLQNGQWEVLMSMNPSASNKWAEITEINQGNFVAIVLDGQVKSCPVINQKIDGGRSSISGDFSSSEAKDLANILGSGKLQSKLDIIQQSVVGPTLGQESIESGLQSFILALILVLLYMIFYYKGAGLVSNVALVANVFFILGVLASKTTLVLTLPGIAGIVLTIGMAVDANVLIYERIREELANGKGIRLAISDGYKNAYTSIIDANVTTLLTGIILYIFGTGPIQGFATTLIIGIITSLFSAIFITRLIISYRLNKGKSISFYNRITKGAFKNFNIDFVGKRKVFYIVSSLIIISGVYSLSTKGLNYGIDFAGGRTYIVSVPEINNTDNKDIQERLSKVFINEDGSPQPPQVTTFSDLSGGSDMQQLSDGDTLMYNRRAVKITTKYMINSERKDADSVVRASLLAGLGEGVSEENILNYEKVASTIADDIRDSAWGSIGFSLLVIFLYILIRFRRWQFSLGAVAAVFHDVLIVLSVFSIFYGILPFTLEIDQAFVAAILTIIGYSLNDTVVVFDRIRENIMNFRKKEIHELVNVSLNSTLSRTINTSLTTFCVLLIIFIFGGEVIKGFMFALMVGVVVGTYSSLFVASPIMMDTIKRKRINDE